MNKYIKILLVFLISLFMFSIVDAKDKEITMYFFHGDGCPHCAAENKFIKEHDEFKSIIIVRYEVWNNDDNIELLKKVGTKFDVKAKNIPFNVIGNTIITGFSDSAGTGNKILNTIKYYKANPDKYHDVVKDVLNDKMEVVKVNDEAINYYCSYT